jgi:hypothetical protein
MLQRYVLTCGQSVTAFLALPQSRRPGQGPRSPYPKASPGCDPLLIDEQNGVSNGRVHVTLSIKISLCSSAIADNRSARFDPSIYKGKQGVNSSVWYWNKKCSARLTQLRQATSNIQPAQDPSAS